MNLAEATMKTVFRPKIKAAVGIAAAAWLLAAADTGSWLLGAQAGEAPVAPAATGRAGGRRLEAAHRHGCAGLREGIAIRWAGAVVTAGHS